MYVYKSQIIFFELVGSLETAILEISSSYDFADSDKSDLEKMEVMFDVHLHDEEGVELWDAPKVRSVGTRVGVYVRRSR